MAVVLDGDPLVEVFVLADCQPDLSLLPPADQDRYRRFIDTEAADFYLRRQSQLRRRLGAELNLAPGAVELTTVGNQKPALLADGPPLHFNISSSGPLMAMAISRRGPVGVDIECHRIHTGLKASSLAPALHETELELLAGDDLEDTLQCWVFKEAWIKWTAEGMRADLKNLHLWRPGLPDRFVADGAEVNLNRVGPETRLLSDEPPLQHQAWLGVVRAAEGADECGI